jgi:HlyD family secretion protein
VDRLCGYQGRHDVDQGLVRGAPASSTGDRKKASRVYLEEVERQDISRLVKASGEIDPRVKVNLSAHVIARIEKLFVEEGDSIEAGDPVLELEKEAFVAIRDRAVAELSIARSRLRQAEIELEDNDLKLRRMQRLADEMVISSEQLESSQLQHKSAELKLEQGREAVIQAQASLDKAKDDLSKTTIFAPLSGRVIELRAEEGEVVVSGTMNNPASVIGIIADLSEILAVVDVPTRPTPVGWWRSAAPAFNATGSPMSPFSGSRSCWTSRRRCCDRGCRFGRGSTPPRGPTY